MTPPFTTVGSKSPASSRAATMVVVVVLPWVPATATLYLSRISSASISARRTTGMPCARAASSSGLPGLMAEEITTTSAPSMFSARWPSKIVAPMPASRSVILLALRSEPCTEYPWFSSTSAMPDMPMPPMPTKWMMPTSPGSFVAAFMISPLSARGFRPGRPVPSRHRAAPGSARRGPSATRRPDPPARPGCVRRGSRRSGNARGS